MGSNQIFNWLQCDKHEKKKKKTHQKDRSEEGWVKDIVNEVQGLMISEDSENLSFPWLSHPRDSARQKIKNGSSYQVGNL